MILVPTDFTKVAECALNHALKLASTLHTDIFLLHVIEKEKAKLADFRSMLNNLEQQQRKIQAL